MEWWTGGMGKGGTFIEWRGRRRQIIHLRDHLALQRRLLHPQVFITWYGPHKLHRYHRALSGRCGEQPRLWPVILCKRSGGGWRTIGVLRENWWHFWSNTNLSDDEGHVGPATLPNIHCRPLHSWAYLAELYGTPGAGWYQLNNNMTLLT